MPNRGQFFVTLGDFGADYLEIALDQVQDRLISDEVLRELPIFKTIIGLARASLSIRDQLFVKKVQTFLETQDRHTRTEAQDIIRRLDANPNDRERLAQSIVLLLDQFDDMEKVALFARAFLHLFVMRLSRSTFLEDTARSLRPPT